MCIEHCTLWYVDHCAVWWVFHHAVLCVQHHSVWYVSHCAVWCVGHCVLWCVHRHAVWRVGHCPMWCMDHPVVWDVDLCIWNSKSFIESFWSCLSSFLSNSSNPVMRIYQLSSYFGCWLIYPTTCTGVTWEWVLLSHHHWIPVRKPKEHFAYSRYSINIRWTKMDLINLCRFNMLCMMNNSVLRSELLSLVKVWVRLQKPHWNMKNSHHSLIFTTRDSFPFLGIPLTCKVDSVLPILSTLYPSPIRHWQHQSVDTQRGRNPTKLCVWTRGYSWELHIQDTNNCQRKKGTRWLIAHFSTRAAFGTKKPDYQTTDTKTKWADGILWLWTKDFLKTWSWMLPSWVPRASHNYTWLTGLRSRGC